MWRKDNTSLNWSSKLYFSVIKTDCECSSVHSDTQWNCTYPCFLKIFIYLFTFLLHQVLVAAHGLFIAACRLLSCSMHAGSSSPTRDQTWEPCIGSAESCPLDHQEVPSCPSLKKSFHTQVLPNTDINPQTYFILAHSSLKGTYKILLEPWSLLLACNYISIKAQVEASQLHS